MLPLGPTGVDQRRSPGHWPPDEWSSDANVLVLTHGEEAPGAHRLDVLIECGLTPESRQVRCARDLPEPALVDIAILIGSQSAAEAEASGHHQAECDWVRRVDEAGGKLLGVGQGPGCWRWPSAAASAWRSIPSGAGPWSTQRSPT